MRKFEFRLGRVLEWRKRQAELEEIKLTQLMAEAQRLEAALRELEETRTMSQRAIVSSPSPATEDFWMLRDYLSGAKRQKQVLTQQIADQMRRVEAQRLLTMAARQRREALEKLRQNRYDDWRREAEKEMESMASEAFLARWSREAPSGSAG